MRVIYLYNIIPFFSELKQDVSSFSSKTNISVAVCLLFIVIGKKKKLLKVAIKMFEEYLCALG